MRLIPRTGSPGKTLSESLSSLMVATNSILSITNRVISVSPRQKERVNNPPVFYGYNDRLRRTPMILKFESINTGVQRVFNSLTLNDFESRDITSINIYGFKELQAINHPICFLKRHCRGHREINCRDT